MSGFNFLKALVEISEYDVKTGEYISVGDVSFYDEVADLQESLNAIGASVSDYQVTKSPDGDVYLCRPCLCVNDCDQPALMFTPKNVYQLPKSTVLMGVDQLKVKNGAEPITIRKVKGADPKGVALYVELNDLAAFKQFVKLMSVVDYLDSIYQESVTLTLTNVKEVQGKFKSHEATFRDINSSELKLKINEKKYVKMNAILAKYGERLVTLHKVGWEMGGKSGYTFDISLA